MDEWNRNRRFQSDYDDVEPDRDDRKGRRRREQDAHRKEELDHELDRGLEDTFPGSDPVSVIQPSGGRPNR